MVQQSNIIIRDGNGGNLTCHEHESDPHGSVAQRLSWKVAGDIDRIMQLLREQGHCSDLTTTYKLNVRRDKSTRSYTITATAANGTSPREVVACEAGSELRAHARAVMMNANNVWDDHRDCHNSHRSQRLERGRATSMSVSPNSSHSSTPLSSTSSEAAHPEAAAAFTDHVVFATSIPSDANYSAEPDTADLAAPATLATLAAAERAASAPAGRSADRAYGEGIEGGFVDPLLYPNVADRDYACTRLDQLLRDPAADPDQVYNLAIYITNAAPHLDECGNLDECRNSDLFENLRSWMIERAFRNGAETDPALRDKQRTLLLALSDTPNALYGPLARPLRQAEAAHTNPLAFACDLLDSTSTANPSLRATLERALTDAETLTDDENRLLVPTLTAPTEGTRHTSSRTRVSRARNQSLLDQARSRQTEFTMFLNGIGGPGCEQGREWLARRDARNAHIRENLLASIQAVAANETPADATLPITLEVDERLVPSAEEVSTAALATQDENARLAALTHTARLIHYHLTTLTGMACTERTAEELCLYVQEHGTLPRALQNALERQGGNGALVLSQLLYYYNALRVPPKPGFEGIAPLSSLNWLTEGMNPVEQSRCLLQLVKALHDDFQDHSLTEQQARWGESIYNLFRGEASNPIYAEAGSGKTALAQFMIRFLPNVRPECRGKTVHWLSPYATSVDGMVCHQFERGRGLGIDVAFADDFQNHVVLVDESHVMAPNAPVVFRALDGTQQAASVLPITATPIIPHQEYAQDLLTQFGPTCDATLQRLDQQMANIQVRITAEKKRLRHEQIRQHASALLQSTQRAFCSSNRFTMHIPHAMRMRYASDVQTLKKFLAVLEREPARAHEVASFIQRFANRFQDVVLRSTVEQSEHFIPLNRAGMNNLRVPNDERRHYDGRLVQAEQFLQQMRSLEESLLELNTVDPSPALGRLEQQRAALVRAGDTVVSNRVRLLSQVQPEREAGQQHDAVRANRRATIDSMQYVRTDFLPCFQDTDSPDNTRHAAAWIAQQISNVESGRNRTGRVQVILPGVRFTNDNYLPFINNLERSFRDGRSTIQYPLRFVYHDSHTEPGFPTFGQDVVVEFLAPSSDTSGPIFSRIGSLGSATPLPSDGTTIMLYDATNQQGGDFGSLSQATPERDVQQLIFYNFADEGDGDPAAVASENDIYQAMRRRRGESRFNSVVFASPASQEAFTANASRQQTALERTWAVSVAASRIATKILMTDMISGHVLAASEHGLAAWERDKLRLIHSSEHEKLTRLVARVLLNPDSEEARTFAATWDSMRRVKTQTLEQSLAHAPHLVEDSWHALNAFEEADVLLQWARGYGAAPAEDAAPTVEADAVAADADPIAAPVAADAPVRAASPAPALDAQPPIPRPLSPFTVQPAAATNRFARPARPTAVDARALTAARNAPRVTSAGRAAVLARTKRSLKAEQTRRDQIARSRQTRKATIRIGGR